MPKLGHQVLQEVMEVRRLEARLTVLQDRQVDLFLSIECETLTRTETEQEVAALDKEIEEIESTLNR